jgi:hypothetical protein
MGFSWKNMDNAGLHVDYLGVVVGNIGDYYAFSQ